MEYVLLFSVFVIATCGLVYELISGALASYLLGDSVTQFSTVIGVYLFSMGVGSYLSKHIHRNLIAVFIQVELIVGLVGGFSASLLFVLFEFVTSFRILLFSIVSLTGTLVGLEIPLLMRILQKNFEFKDLVSKVFTFDYVGALLASLLFPLVLVPHLGLVRSAFLFGIINVCVGLWALFLFRREVAWGKALQSFGTLALISLALGFAYSEQIMKLSEMLTFQDTVVYAKSSPYQRIVLTKNSSDLRLFLNGNLQFSSRDEYRYHEALVHVGLASLTEPKNVLILGGGDGLAAREILKYPSVTKIKLVDLDPEITKLFSTHDSLVKLNAGALKSPKLEIINQDAFVWIKDNKERFDFVVVDFPDPANFSIGKLYSNTFYRYLYASLTEEGRAVVQSTSPYVAKKSFWCVNNTLDSVGFVTFPYHVYVPAFGDWGYIIAAKGNYKIPTLFPDGLKFIDKNTVGTFFNFPRDMVSMNRDINKLNNQILVKYFEDEWSEYIQ